MTVLAPKQKKEKVDVAISELSRYSMIYKVLCENRTAYIQKIRKLLRNKNTEMLFGKYRMVEKGLSHILSPDEMNKLKSKTPYKKSDKIYFYVFSDLPQEEIADLIKSVTHIDYEILGAPLKEDLVLPIGPLLKSNGERVSNNLFVELKELGLNSIKTNPKTNELELTEETTLGKAGDAITKEIQKVLRLLAIKNKDHHAEIVSSAKNSKGNKQ